MDMVHDISDWVVVMAEGRDHRRGHRRRRSRANQDVIDAYLGAHHDVDLGHGRRREELEQLDSSEAVDRQPRSGPAMTATTRHRGHRARRRLRPRGQHPQRLQPDVGAGRVRRHHRPQRRRQVDAAEGGARAGPRALRHGAARRRGHHRPSRPPARRSGASASCPRPTTCSPALTVRENLEMGCFLQPEALQRALRRTSPACSRGSASGPTSGPARCRAASARWWRWAGR